MNPASESSNEKPIIIMTLLVRDEEDTPGKTGTSKHVAAVPQLEAPQVAMAVAEAST